MKWSRKSVTQSLPKTVTDMTEPADDAVLHEFPAILTESAHFAGATFEWELGGRFRHPATWTQQEARAGLAALIWNMDRARCLTIIAGLPDELVTVVRPQLEEIVEYEARMAVARHEATGPDIKERWISLPAGV